MKRKLKRVKKFKGKPKEIEVVAIQTGYEAIDLCEENGKYICNGDALLKLYPKLRKLACPNCLGTQQDEVLLKVTVQAVECRTYEEGE